MGHPNRSTIWAVLTVIGFLMLVWLSRSNSVAPRVKARAQRIATVNHVRSVTLTLTNLSVPPATLPSAGK